MHPVDASDVRRCKDMKIFQFCAFFFRVESIADTLVRHREGILAWYDCRISNGKLEDINNKIKTMKRQA